MATDKAAASTDNKRFMNRSLMRPFSGVVVKGRRLRVRSVDVTLVSISETQPR
jgi:hypothetical protein